MTDPTTTDRTPIPKGTPTVPDQTATPDPIVAITKGGRSITNTELLAALDVADLTRYRLQLVHDGQRTLVAAFATPWLADLASTLFSTIPSRPDLAWDRYEVEGLRVDEDPHPLQLQLNSQELLATAVLPPG